MGKETTTVSQWVTIYLKWDRKGAEWTAHGMSSIFFLLNFYAFLYTGRGSYELEKLLGKVGDYAYFCYFFFFSHLLGVILQEYNLCREIE